MNISNEIDKEILKYLEAIDRIDWEKENLNINLDNTQNNPVLKKINDSILNIKSKYDKLIIENKKINEKLYIHKKFEKLKTEINKLSYDNKLDEKEFIQSFLNITGPAFNFSRACFNKFSNKDYNKSDLVCIFEWLAPGVKPTAGSKIPNSIIKHFMNDFCTELTIEKASEKLPGILRPVLKPLIKALADSQNLHSTLIFPYYLQGNMDGLFSFDICKDNLDKPEMNEEKINFLSDLISTAVIIKEKKHQNITNEDNTISNYNDKITNEENAEIFKKTLMLETSLDIMSHDTKNIFFNIYVLIQQFMNLPISSLIKDNIDELYEIIMETAGVLQLKKRIFGLIGLIEKIKLTKDRKTLKDYKRINLSYNFPYDLFIETSALFKSALTNIIENALKYSPENKNVDIVIDRIDDMIFIHIKDSGCGISDDDKKKVFDKFYRIHIHKNIEGTGRGLWITQNILNKEGGFLLIDDNPEGGSIFTIKIPAFKITNLEQKLNELSEWFEISYNQVKFKAETIRSFLIMQEKSKIIDMDTAVFTSLLVRLREDSKEKDLSHINKKLELYKTKNPDGKKVLIIDDSIYVHFYLASHLSEFGYRIIGYANNGEEGLYLYKKYKPDFITLDNTMPVMSGTELAKEIYKKNKNIKIIFITAVGDNSLFKKELTNIIPEKNYRVLLKPVKKDDLKSVLLNFDL